LYYPDFIPVQPLSFQRVSSLAVLSQLSRIQKPYQSKHFR